MDTNIQFINTSSKLFATFTTEPNLAELISLINKKYTVLYNKIFVLQSEDSDELIVTYNIDTANTVSNPIENTILVHRKKDSNTLYTINALNNLIKSLNEGVLDFNYKVDWNNYRNCILLTQGEDVRMLKTAIHSIITY